MQKNSEGETQISRQETVLQTLVQRFFMSEINERQHCPRHLAPSRPQFVDSCFVTELQGQIESDNDLEYGLEWSRQTQ